MVRKSSSASESVKKLGLRGVRVVGRVAALAFAIGFFVVLPVSAIIEGRWVALFLWILLITLMWIGNTVAPREI
ncbi:hypothetical protein HPS36_02000 [Halorubrum salinarum]|uniref:Phosphatidate cytidylyltransferase n=1 Tax=Halorubrum salinarum TaxID=2739057 RepID=A0A7D4BV81_9EURY|nr:hypothetical protein [Halorubrum salinarum]QKG91675.1 hypothetical protein HPS36_02000 [Halorubrum salinarum]